MNYLILLVQGTVSYFYIINEQFDLLELSFSKEIGFPDRYIIFFSLCGAAFPNKIFDVPLGSIYPSTKVNEVLCVLMAPPKRLWMYAQT